jgi:succinate dehydrogenase/fumarate reductase flavoprotein subunit
MDVVVVGAGMAGLSAATSAARSGATVTLVESSSEVGGAARWSAGRIWTFGSLGELRSRVPLGDLRLQDLLVSGLPEALSWLESLPLPVRPQPAHRLGMGATMQAGEVGDRGPFLRLFADRAVESGVDLRLAQRVSGLAVHPDGVRVSIGSTELKASTVVIATGGFQGDRSLLRRYFGPEAQHLMIRSNDTSVGDGLRLGLAVGGAHSRGMADFYGHTMPWQAQRLRPSEYKSATLAIAAEAVLVNRLGMRFTDESSGIVEEDNAVAGMYQPGGEYFLVCAGPLAHRLPSDMLTQLAQRASVGLEEILLTADSIDELVELMGARWSVPTTPLSTTLHAAQQSARGVAGVALSPPRVRPLAPLDEAPFVAVRCVPGITLPYGGLSVDAQLRLLDEADRPVPRVYVAGADAGGVHFGAYAGGLSWALVSGRVAGANAANAALGREDAANAARSTQDAASAARREEAVATS